MRVKVLNIFCRLRMHRWWKPRFVNVRECLRCGRREIMLDQASPYHFRWEKLDDDGLDADGLRVREMP